MKRRTFLKTTGALVLCGGAGLPTVRRSQAAAAGCVVVVLVLVVGGYVVYKIYRWCKTYLGNPTNNPPVTYTNIGPLSALALPPLVGGAHGTNAVAMQSSSDLKSWEKELEVVLDVTSSTVTATVRKEGYAPISKSGSIVDDGSGPTAFIDMQVETMGQFPLPKGNYFRLLSLE